MDSEHTLPYDTVIEIYDDEQIYNVLAVTEFKPQNAVYIGTRKLKSKRVKNSISPVCAVSDSIPNAFSIQPIC